MTCLLLTCAFQWGIFTTSVTSFAYDEDFELEDYDTIPFPFGKRYVGLSEGGGLSRVGLGLVGGGRDNQQLLQANTLRSEESVGGWSTLDTPYLLGKRSYRPSCRRCSQLFDSLSCRVCYGGRGRGGGVNSVPYFISGKKRSFSPSLGRIVEHLSFTFLIFDL